MPVGAATPQHTSGPSRELWDTAVRPDLHPVDWGRSPSGESPVQRLSASEEQSNSSSALLGARSEEEVASHGMSGKAGPVPYAGEMGRAFGTDFSGVKSFAGGGAARACAALDAQAYTYGSAVAFAEESPDRAVVAHELAHVVQQRGGSSAVMRLGNETSDAPVGDLEEQAHRAAAQVMAGQRVTTPLSSAGPTVSRLRRFGEALYEPMHTPLMGADRSAGGTETQPLHARTIEEWNAIFESGDRSDPNHIERHAFLMAALNRRGFEELGVTHPGGYRFVTVRGTVTEEEKVALARAALHSGGSRTHRRDMGLLGRALPARPTGVFIAGAGSDLWAEFMQRYTGPALEERSRGTREMDEGAVDRVEAFAQANAETGNSETNAATLGSALGRACGSAIEYLTSFVSPADSQDSEGGGGEGGEAQADRAPRYEELNLIFNSAATVGGVVRGIEHYNAAQAERSATAWRTIASGIAVLSAGTLSTLARALFSAFFSMSNRWFQGLARSESPSTANLITEFRRVVREFSMEHNIDPNHYDACVNQFTDGLQNFQE